MPSVWDMDRRVGVCVVTRDGLEICHVIFQGKDSKIFYLGCIIHRLNALKLCKMINKCGQIKFFIRIFAVTY